MNMTTNLPIVLFERPCEAPLDEIFEALDPATRLELALICGSTNPDQIHAALAAGLNGAELVATAYDADGRPAVLVAGLRLLPRRIGVSVLFTTRARGACLRVFLRWLHVMLAQELTGRDFGSAEMIVDPMASGALNLARATAARAGARLTVETLRAVTPGRGPLLRLTFEKETP